jgi:hypothetical protein
MSVNEHEFKFLDPSDSPDCLLCIGNRRRPHHACAHKVQEENAFLCGIWGPFATGMLKRRLTRNDEVVSLEYCYEYEGGVSLCLSFESNVASSNLRTQGAWVLEIQVVDMNATIDQTFRLDAAIGCSPMEGCQDPDEWRRIKMAFANPQSENAHEGIEYARSIS